MGWLITFALLKDRIMLILFKLIKLGIIKTSSKGFNGYSIVIGFWKLELQVNLSIVNNISIELKEYEKARA